MLLDDLDGSRKHARAFTSCRNPRFLRSAITGEEFVETVDTIDELAPTVFEESQPVTNVRDLPTEKDNKSNKAGVLDFLPGWKTIRLRPLNSQ